MQLRLVLYDIAEDRYRNKLAKTLEAMGFIRIQNSVFAGMHSKMQWKKLWKQIMQLHNKRGEADDKVYSIIVSKKMFRSMHVCGSAPPVELILEEQIVLWI